MHSNIRKDIMFLILDIMFIIMGFCLGLILRFDLFEIPVFYIYNLLETIVFQSLIYFFFLILSKAHKRLWSYASLLEVFTLIFFLLLAGVTNYFAMKSLKVMMPISYYILSCFSIIGFICGSRILYRFYKSKFIFLNKRKNAYIRTMIIGAGDAGNLLTIETLKNPQAKENIVCFIDDDKNKKNHYVRGIPIVGDRTKIVEYANKMNIDKIIIAIPSAPKEEIKTIINICKETNCEIFILPNIYELIGTSIYKNIRKISFEDLLGRDSVVVNNEEISTQIKNKVILVTGGGGSIGSELSRQIALNNPKKLILLDIYENSIYEIQRELINKFPKLDLVILIASVRDKDRINQIFKEYKPDIVYHAAAHKHVPLMEDNPHEAIKNNCFGTLNLVLASNKYKVKKFILISTDKAVRPTNIMGASKRICEMIIQTYNKKSNTDFVAVRFGNVLGSNGSVIPLFLKQIDEGGPITVTHKDITRFFMTIPEAVSLVLQAGYFANGGEIFVLDMGTPVKIYDLAVNLIRLRGLQPHKDIKIKITGLRPGEKLYEEILMDEEGMDKTPNKTIFIGKPIDINEKKFMKQLDRLYEFAHDDNSSIKGYVATVVDTYVVDNQKTRGGINE